MITRRLPKKLSEHGRIRIGDRETNSKGAGTHPHKLSSFRLTSPNAPLLNVAASLYGGEVRPWSSDGAPKDDYGRPTQWELYTQANSIDVLIPTMSACTLWYELWSAAGCQRRCDGVTIQQCPLQEALIGEACICPLDDQERAEQAKTGKACARILRLNVLLPDLPGLGTWRLETKGFYGTAELLGTLDLLKDAGAEHTIIEAVLRLEQRTVKRPGKGEGRGTLKFVVPVLWPKYSPRQLLAQASHVLLAPPAQPIPSLEATIADIAGDQAQITVGLQAARAGEEFPLLRQQIDALLDAQGVTAAGIADWWQKMSQKYADFTPGVLTMLLDRLRAASEEDNEAAPDDPRQTSLLIDDREAHLLADQAPGEDA